MKASAYVLIGEDLIPADEACLPVQDRGFLFGDAVYETLRSYGARPFLLEEHLQRLRRSAAGLYMTLPWTDAELGGRLRRLIEANGISEGRIRITVTRGDGDVRARPEALGPARLIISAQALPPESGARDPKVVHVEISRRIRNLPGALDPAIKSANFLNNLLARFEMRDRDSYEVLLPNLAGDLTEGSLSNFFIVDGAGRLRTPALECGLLPGITRRLVLDAAREDGLDPAECRIKAADLAGAKEAFLTASTIEIAAIGAVEGRPLGAPAPGPVTRRLHALYRERVREYCARQER